MTFGPFEIILILVVIALLFGAKKLPELMKGMGQGIREFKNEVKDPAAPAPGQPTQTVVSAQPAAPVTPVVDVASRQLDPVRIDPVTGAPVVNEPVVQTPGERR
ncbi:twin-arginine translocase TatA/TatE family subunit [Deinococcus sp. VB343]|uniref:Sec-independent protein translocase protein TatA n=1 Tax=Deinococcus sp. VB142 TaxID=3112952 RepID=A0AAU6Q4U2_9DEIO|nr:twin-arginine translocase TatA/TatE family subunit [Deinococcus sp.]MDO4247321.1 twin-arginine translocase TatA/TatE family subunit [Deinococcus sp.]